MDTLGYQPSGGPHGRFVICNGINTQGDLYLANM